MKQGQFQRFLLIRGQKTGHCIYATSKKFLNGKGISVMGRRGENIRKRKDGRWEARVIYTHDLSGKAKYRSFYGRTYLEAKKKKNEFIQNHLNPDHVSNGRNQAEFKITLKQLMEEWMESRRNEVKESTFAHYKNIVEKHILPALGETCLQNLQTETIDDFLKEKLISGRIDRKGGLSPKTVADIRSVLVLALKLARKKHYACQIEQDIYYPKIRRSAAKVLTREEQAKLEQFLFQNPSPLGLGILLVLYGGLRIGELCALKWKDFNPESGTIRINKTLIRIQNVTSDSQEKTKIMIGQPKTESSNRLIPLSSFLTELLIKHQKSDETYLITGNKSYLEPRVCLDKYKHILNQAGLHSFTFHSLRHTFATRCVESGFDIKSLSEILGHANINTTLQRYVHPSIEAKKQQMDRLEEISVWGQN